MRACQLVVSNDNVGWTYFNRDDRCCLMLQEVREETRAKDKKKRGAGGDSDTEDAATAVRKKIKKAKGKKH